MIQDIRHFIFILPKCICGIFSFFFDTGFTNKRFDFFNSIRVSKINPFFFFIIFRLNGKKL